ncbi:MAG: MarR family transcriptional regulator [bacterium]|jgi:DNA-binding MarR family transcriptional regulator|nr:MarR family transcriptional regulator [bacterium]
MFINDPPQHETIQQFADQFKEVDPLAFEVYVHFLKTSHELISAADTHFSEFGTSPGRFLIMMLLKRWLGKGLTPSQLAQKSGVTRATITGLLDGLEHDHLISRQPAPQDRRSMIIHLTPEGVQFLDTILPTHFSRVSGVMQHLTISERHTFIQLLKKIAMGIPCFQTIPRIDKEEPPHQRDGNRIVQEATGSPAPEE